MISAHLNHHSWFLVLFVSKCQTYSGFALLQNLSKGSKQILYKIIFISEKTFQCQTLSRHFFFCQGCFLFDSTFCYTDSANLPDFDCIYTIQQIRTSMISEASGAVILFTSCKWLDFRNDHPSEKNSCWPFRYAFHPSMGKLNLPGTEFLVLPQTPS